jgi:hypothetical protein
MKKMGSAILMIIAILGITGFQAYWLKNNYDREKQNLDIKTSATFRQTILQLQASKLKLDKFIFRYDSTNMSTVNLVKNKGKRPKPFKKPVSTKEPAISILNLVQERMRDSIRLDTMGKKTVIISVRGDNDSARRKLIDSFHRMSGRVRTISVVSPDSIPVRDKMVGKVFVDEGHETILRDLHSAKSLDDR